MAGRWALCAEGPVRLHLSVDTGLGREGHASSAVAAAARSVLRRARRWRLAGVYTKWCCSRDAFAMREAAGRFAAAARAARQAARRQAGGGGGRGLMMHVGGGLLQRGSGWAPGDFPRAWLIRVGRALLGDPGRVGPLPGLRPALVWKKRLAKQSNNK